jgi:hypothetical protein
MNTLHRPGQRIETVFTLHGADPTHVREHRQIFQRVSYDRISLGLMERVGARISL